MKILIAYASSTGTTEKCVNMLAAKLPQAEIRNLAKNKLTPPDPTPYDMVIVGGGIRGGVINSEVQVYLKNCADILAQKKFGVFICCGDDAKSDALLAKNVPDILMQTAKAAMSFGGELEPSRARGLDKVMLKLMKAGSRKNGSEMHLFPERIDEFASKMLDA